MTLDEALNLRVGDHVTHVATAVSRKPIRVTALWTNATRTIVCLRCASIKSSIEWVDATGYDLPPAGLVYDYKYSEWVTPAEKKNRNAGMQGGAAPRELR